MTPSGDKTRLTPSGVSPAAQDRDDPRIPETSEAGSLPDTQEGRYEGRPGTSAAQDQRDPWTIAYCPFCGDPARWSQRDRLSWCWQCPNPEHGYKYLDADQVEWVKVRRV